MDPRAQRCCGEVPSQAGAAVAQDPADVAVGRCAGRVVNFNVGHAVGPAVAVGQERAALNHGLKGVEVGFVTGAREDFFVPLFCKDLDVRAASDEVGVGPRPDDSEHRQQQKGHAQRLTGDQFEAAYGLGDKRVGDARFDLGGNGIGGKENSDDDGQSRHDKQGCANRRGNGVEDGVEARRVPVHGDEDEDGQRGQDPEAHPQPLAESDEGDGPGSPERPGGTRRGGSA